MVLFESSATFSAEGSYNRQLSFSLGSWIRLKQGGTHLLSRKDKAYAWFFLHLVADSAVTKMTGVLRPE
jgi:hypothetical protein